MLKSTFSKYLITFVIITLISFVILSGIITSMIRGYFFEERETRVVNTSKTISSAIEHFGQTDIDAPGFLSPFISDMITTLINNDTGINILVLDEFVNCNKIAVPIIHSHPFFIRKFNAIT